jgi:hypothetical protein
MNLTRPLVLLLGLGGCVAGAEGPPAVRQSWSHAVMMADCAPWDGAATTIMLSNAEVTRESNPRPLLWLSIDTSSGVVGGHRWPLGQSKDGGGHAAWCPLDGECTTSTSGWVEVGTVTSGQAIKGQYHVTFLSGRTLESEFSATFDPRRVLCG